MRENESFVLVDIVVGAGKDAVVVILVRIDATILLVLLITAGRAIFPDFLIVLVTVVTVYRGIPVPSVRTIVVRIAVLLILLLVAVGTIVPDLSSILVTIIFAGRGVPRPGVVPVVPGGAMLAGAVAIVVVAALERAIFENVVILGIGRPDLLGAVPAVEGPLSGLVPEVTAVFEGDAVGLVLILLVLLLILIGQTRQDAAVSVVAGVCVAVIVKVIRRTTTALTPPVGAEGSVGRVAVAADVADQICGFVSLFLAPSPAVCSKRCGGEGSEDGESHHQGENALFAVFHLEKPSFQNIFYKIFEGNFIKSATP